MGILNSEEDRLRKRIATLEERIEDLESALTPFALFANAAKEIAGPDATYRTPVAQYKHQTLVLGVFDDLRNLLGLDK